MLQSETTWLTAAQTAKLKGCATSTITRAIGRGDLPSKRGKVRAEDAAAFEVKVRRPRRTAAEPEKPADPKPAKPTEDDEPKLSEFQAANQRLKIIALERAEAEWKRDQGLTLERAQVEALLRDFGHRMRREIQSLPRKMQAAMVRDIRCRKCGGDCDGKAIAIAAEQFVAGVLRELAKNPLGEAK